MFTNAQSLCKLHRATSSLWILAVIITDENLPFSFSEFLEIPRDSDVTRHGRSEPAASCGSRSPRNSKIRSEWPRATFLSARRESLAFSSSSSSCSSGRRERHVVVSLVSSRATATCCSLQFEQRPRSVPPTRSGRTSRCPCGGAAVPSRIPKDNDLRDSGVRGTSSGNDWNSAETFFLLKLHNPDITKARSSFLPS